MTSRVTRPPYLPIGHGSLEWLVELVRLNAFFDLFVKKNLIKKYKIMYEFEVLINNELCLLNIVDEADYNRLLTDDEFVIQFVYDLLRQGDPNGPQVSPYDISTGRVQICRVTQNTEESEEQGNTEGENMEESEEIENIERDTSEKNNSVWVSHSRNNENDQAATRLLLELRGSEQFEKKFSDKKTIKMSLWKQIAQIMVENGFNVDAEKCRQKFLNLTKKYVTFVQDSKKTGNKKVDPPMFYDLLHQILGHKDKIKLEDVIDSLPSTSKGKNEETNKDISGSDEKVLKQPNSKMKKKPFVVSKADIMQKIIDCNDKTIDSQNKNMEKVMEAISEQTNVLKQTVAQRERLIDAFVKLAEPKKKDKKRKRKHSSSSESD